MNRSEPHDTSAPAVATTLDASPPGTSPRPDPAKPAQGFSYDEAFSRNLGWVTEAEQQRLRRTRVAIAGLGGVGGVYLLSLARLGIGRFVLADFDTYALANFNRQVGAGMSTIGRPKLHVMVEMALEINPELEIRRFEAGVHPADFDAFLDGVDVYLDGLDFFALDVRAALFGRCARERIPATTVAPLGMGAALLNFVPGGMSFEDYFGFEGQNADERALRFLTGLSPSMLQLPYLVDPSRVDLAARRGPSTVVGIQLCAAVAAGQVVKLVLGRGDLVVAPAGLHLDIYRNRLKKTWRPGGHRHPVQRLMRRIARSRLAGGSTGASGAPQVAGAPDSGDPHPAVARVLAAARTAPSADNRPAVGIVARDDGFDLRLLETATGAQSHERWLKLVAAGAMAENMLLRAGEIGRPLALRPPPSRAQADGPAIALDWLASSEAAPPSPLDARLAASIEARHTNRRFFDGQRSAPAVLQQIAEAASGVPGAELVWFDTPELRRLALGSMRQAEGERFRRDALHRELFEAIRFDVGWRRSAPLGLSPGALEVEAVSRPMFAALRHAPLMRAARWLGAASLLGFRAAYLPARSAPHLGAIVVRDAEGDSAGVAAGRALERAWLAAQANGLAFQPLAAVGALIRMRPGGGWVAAALQARLREAACRLAGSDRPETLHIMLRIGFARPATVRSSRPETSDFLGQTPMSATLPKQGG